MGLKAATETTTVGAIAVPRINHTPGIPHEILDEILDILAADLDWRDRGDLPRFLRSCSLVSKSWVSPCRRHLFRSITFDEEKMEKWLKTFPVPEKSPAYHVRELRLRLTAGDYHPGEFFGRVRWFTHLKTMAVSEEGAYNWLEIPSFVELPQSITSLAIEGHGVGLVQMRDLMAQLPNLEDLSLFGAVEEGGAPLPELGEVLKATFSGRLYLHASGIDGIVDMLLEVPTGLHFTKISILDERECRFLVVRLAETCRETLVELIYDDLTNDDDLAFNFSKFLSLQNICFDLRPAWEGGLRWVSATLATLKPTTTPQLSKIRIRFTDPSRIRTRRLEKVHDDIRRIADEFTRIEHEYGGTVNLTVTLDSGFSQLDVNKVLQRWKRQAKVR